MQQHFWNNAKDVLHQFDDNHPQKVMSIAPNLSSTASSISTVVVRFPPKPTIHIAFDQSYQHPIDKITMQTFGTAVIDHILHILITTMIIKVNHRVKDTDIVCEQKWQAMPVLIHSAHRGKNPDVISPSALLVEGSAPKPL